MASIWKDPRSGNWLIKFRFAGKAHCKSCQSSRESDALRVKATVEETIAMLNTGRITPPNGPTDLGLWIFSGGKLAQRPKIEAKAPKTLEEVSATYQEDQHHKADTTLVGEGCHIAHLKRLLGSSKRFDAIGLATIRDYAKQRLAENSRLGGMVSGKTVRKELVTFNQLWVWARQNDIVQGPSAL